MDDVLRRAWDVLDGAERPGGHYLDNVSGALMRGSPHGAGSVGVLPFVARAVLCQAVEGVLLDLGHAHMRSYDDNYGWVHRAGRAIASHPGRLTAAVLALEAERSVSNGKRD